MILLGGGTKKRQDRDIEDAKEVWRKYRAQKKAALKQAAAKAAVETKRKWEEDMALTRDFRDTIRERAQREPAFRQALLREGMQLINEGDFATGRGILRNYINATIGYKFLYGHGSDAHCPPCSGHSHSTAKDMGAKIANRNSTLGKVFDRRG